MGDESENGQLDRVLDYFSEKERGPKNTELKKSKPVEAPEQLQFMSAATVRRVRALVGTPAFVYSAAKLKCHAQALLAFPHTNGLTVRYAMKACPNGTILRLMDRLGLHFDCSSVHEAQRALAAGIAPTKLSLSTQELPDDFAELIAAGVLLNACSLTQLERFGQRFSGGELGIRFNPGLGSGSTGKTNVGGPDASFGVWYESVGAVREIATRYGLRVVRIHTHIGSGTDPRVWQRVAQMSLELVSQFIDVHTLNLGGTGATVMCVCVILGGPGGFKVARMQSDTGTDLAQVGLPVREAIDQFSRDTGRPIALEIEPGTALLANAGAIVATVQDRVDTGGAGRHFLKLDAGMTEMLRPALYGAQHPLVLVPASERPAADTQERVVVVGHCCESGDLFSCKPGDSETIQERLLAGEARVGDLIVVGGAGAYCSAMAASNYNSFPVAPELLLDETEQLHVIRRRQPLEQIWSNEVRLAADFEKRLVSRL